MPEMLSGFSRWFELNIGLSADTQLKILWTLVVFSILFLTYQVVYFLFSARVKDAARRYTLRKTMTMALSIAGLVFFLRIWVAGRQGLAAYLGILSAGLAIAMQDPLKKIAGWLFIASRKPFDVGDRIQIGEHRGDVIDRRIFQFTLIEIGNWVSADQSTGRIIHLPNGIVFSQAVANYNQGFNFIWNEISVMVTFESDWKKAKDILIKIAEAHTAIQSAHAEQQVRAAARKFLIFFQHLTPIVWTNVEDCGVKLTMRYLCEPRKRRSSQAAIWEAVLDSFAREDGIDFAYPTIRRYDDRVEGKVQKSRAEQ